MEKNLTMVTWDPDRDIVALKKIYLRIHDIYIPVSCMVAP